MTSAVRPWATHPGANEYRGPNMTPGPLRYHQSIPGYACTRLVEVPALAAEWGVGSVWVKEEANRYGLPAFKILGASWAVNCALSRLAGQEPQGSFAELSELAKGLTTTLVTATDGNHGRAVAHVARLLGLPARVYLPAGIADTTFQAISSEGAKVVQTDLLYDDVVALAASELRAEELLVQDTAWEGYEDIPGWIVAGYATLFEEIDSQLPIPATAIAIPAGVGSLLQAGLDHYRQADRVERTTVLCVEPVSAACIVESVAAGESISVDTSQPTNMPGLNCGTISTIAWPIIRDGLDAAIGVTDEETVAAVNRLRIEGVNSGACGAASTAAFGAAMATPGGREALGLSDDSCVVLLSTEARGDND